MHSLTKSQVLSNIKSEFENEFENARIISIHQTVTQSHNHAVRNSQTFHAFLYFNLFFLNVRITNSGELVWS